MLSRRGRGGGWDGGPGVLASPLPESTAATGTRRGSLCVRVCVRACGARCQAEWKLQAASANGHKLPCSFLPRGSCTRMRRRHIHTHSLKPARKHAKASTTQSTPHPSANSPPRPARPAQQSQRCTLSRAKVVANSLQPSPHNTNPLTPVGLCSLLQ